jgi:DNA topoisomerase-1
MANKVLVIGEKPSQVKKISEILFTVNSSVEKVAERLYLRKGIFKGNELTFLPLIGHITTIDTQKEFGWGKCDPVEIVKNPNALVIKENRTFKRIITQQAKFADELWLATDPDSEGDNIAYEAYVMAIRANPTLKHNTRRVWNSSLTNSEILRSFQNLIPWELYLALAVQGRRLIDAWVGFAGTREVTGAARRVKIVEGKKILSVGRVQLPTLKLIVDRDRERSKFKTQLKYNILADILDNKRTQVLVTVKHEKSPFDDKKRVDVVLNNIQDSTVGRVIEFNRRTTNIPPPRPLNTTDALSLLSKELKIKADHAMTLLATLYENGFISYPRTDNRRFKDQFPHKPILLKLNNHPEYVPLIKLVKDTSQVRTNGRKKGPEDHDPIHPTGEIPNESSTIKKIHIKAWDYISRYYIGMFLPDLTQSRGFVRVQIKTEFFSQKYQLTIDEGWTTAISWRKPKETQKFSFKVDQLVQVKNIRRESFKTKPPPNWSDSKLIKQLENYKIGTKSSRPEIIKKLTIRNYIDRKKVSYVATPLGHSLIEVFENIWPEVVTPSFTRMVEQQMDEVATRKVKYEEMLNLLRNHYIQLHEKLLNQLPVLQKSLKNTSILQPESNTSKQKMKKLRKESTSCPLCKEGVLLERFNTKTKQRFFGCSRFPTCRWTSPSRKTKDGNYVPSITSKKKIGSCTACEGMLFLKKIKEFRLIGCSNYPDCKSAYFLPKKGRLTVLKQECPSCKRKLISHSIRKTGQRKPKKEVYCVICQKP